LKYCKGSNLITNTIMYIYSMRHRIHYSKQVEINARS
jgi:hypothetical protein